MSREQWHAERRKGIGSSDVAAIFGLDRWRSAMDVWMEKTGQTEPTEETDAMAAGKALEPVIIRMAQRELGEEIEAWPQDETVEHRRVPAMRATPDAMLVDERECGECWGVECKAVEAPPWESVPMNYQLQVQHQCAVMGWDGAYVAQLTRGTMRLTLHEIRRHDGVIARLEQELPAWWDRHVIGGEAPPPRSIKDVIAVHPRPTDGVIRLDDDAQALVEERARLGAEIKAMEKRRDEIRDALARTMGAAELGVLPGGEVVTFRTRRAYTKKAVEVAESRQVGTIKRLPRDVDQSQIRDAVRSVVW